MPGGLTDVNFDLDSVKFDRTKQLKFANFAGDFLRFLKFDVGKSARNLRLRESLNLRFICGRV